MRPGRGGRGRGGGARRRGEPMRPLVAGAARPGAAPHRVGCGFLWGAARRTVDIYAPNRAHVPVVRADALAIVGIPDRRRVVLCCCEDEVALTVVLDHGQRSLMALDHNGADLPHGCCSLSASLLLLLLLLNRVSAGDLEAWRRVPPARIRAGHSPAPAVSAPPLDVPWPYFPHQQLTHPRLTSTSPSRSSVRMTAQHSPCEPSHSNSPRAHERRGRPSWPSNFLLSHGWTRALERQSSARSLGGRVIEGRSPGHAATQSRRTCSSRRPFCNRVLIGSLCGVLATIEGCEARRESTPFTSERALRAVGA